jgi:hypothetical protein
MKKLALLLPVLFAFGYAAGQKNANPEEAAIKAVIENESKAFFYEINQASWAECWAPVSYAFWSYADTTDVNSFDGWEAIKNGFSDYFSTAKPSQVVISRDWHTVRILGNSAYVRFTQHLKDDMERAPQAEMRVLEKINGKWRIVCVSSIALEKSTPIK